MIDEARRQLEAAGGTPIEWHVADVRAERAIKTLLNNEGYGAIRVVYEPLKAENNEPSKGAT